jgi:hypothetical protein
MTCVVRCGECSSISAKLAVDGALKCAQTLSVRSWFGTGKTAHYTRSGVGSHRVTCRS